MRVTLPVGKPVAYAYQFYAFPLAIQATEPRTEDWILSNYIQVAHDRRGAECDVPFCFYIYDFATSPWLEVIRLTRSWVGAGPQRMVDLVRSALAQGYYAYLEADELYLPTRKHYQVRHFPHDILVHGVDDGDGTFAVLGYNHNFQFRTTRIPQDSLARAHESMDEHDVPDTPVLLYRLRTDAEYGFEPSYVGSVIAEYLTGANSSRHLRMLREPWDRAYGVDSYDYVADFLRAYVDGRTPYDIKSLQVLWEHKRMMTARIDHIARQRPAAGALVERARGVEAMALTLRNGMVRHFITGRTSRFAERLSLLDDIRKAESTLLCDLLAVLG
jgi:hypothetical protein